jgi:hypothetical protein
MLIHIVSTAIHSQLTPKNGLFFNNLFKAFTGKGYSPKIGVDKRKNKKIGKSV